MKFGIEEYVRGFLPLPNLALIGKGGYKSLNWSSLRFSHHKGNIMYTNQCEIWRDTAQYTKSLLSRRNLAPVSEWGGYVSPKYSRLGQT